MTTTGPLTTTFTDTEIHFLAYRLTGATVHPEGVLTAPEIRDADWSPATVPPEIRTHEGETLFVPATQADELERFCGRNAIPHHRRQDLWADLLDPFLDTTFDADTEAATVARLVKSGLSLQEIAETRRKVEPLMLAYNIDSGLWDWTHLGLWDLLSAASGVLVPPALPLTLGDPTEFYNWAMHLADRPGTHP